jgi:hypothetical protein
MVVDVCRGPDYETDSAVRKYAEMQSMYCSFVNADRYDVFELELFVETFSDWGYYGNNPPKWLLGP